MGKDPGGLAVGCGEASAREASSCVTVVGRAGKTAVIDVVVCLKNIYIYI